MTELSATPLNIETKLVADALEAAGWTVLQGFIPGDDTHLYNANYQANLLVICREDGAGGRFVVRVDPWANMLDRLRALNWRDFKEVVYRVGAPVSPLSGAEHYEAARMVLKWAVESDRVGELEIAINRMQ